MKITNAVQDGHNIRLYDQDGNQYISFMAPFANEADDGIKSFDSSSVTVRCGSYLYVYNQDGNQISTKLA